MTQPSNMFVVREIKNKKWDTFFWTPCKKIILISVKNFFAKGNKTHVKKGKIDWLIY